MSCHHSFFVCTILLDVPSGSVRVYHDVAWHAPVVVDVGVC